MPNLQTAQVSNYDFGAPAAALVAASAATATVVFAGLPVDGETVEVGTSRGSFIFEFDSNSAVTAGHVAVAIGVDAATTAANFKAVVNAPGQAAMGVTASGGSTTITLTDNVPGALGNQNTISENATNVTATAWTGGVDESVSEAVLKFTVKYGGKLILTFTTPQLGSNGFAQNPVGNDMTVTAQVSADDLTYNATTNSNNGTAITGVSVPSGQQKEFVLLLRAGIDKFLRIGATGGARGQLQIRAAQSVGLDIARI